MNVCNTGFLLVAKCPASFTVRLGLRHRSHKPR